MCVPCRPWPSDDFVSLRCAAMVRRSRALQPRIGGCPAPHLHRSLTGTRTPFPRVKTSDPNPWTMRPRGPCSREGSNLRSPACRAGALPLSYENVTRRRTGLEPASSPSGALPVELLPRSWRGRDLNPGLRLMRPARCRTPPPRAAGGSRGVDPSSFRPTLRSEDRDRTGVFGLMRPALSPAKLPRRTVGRIRTCDGALAHPLKRR